MSKRDIHPSAFIEEGAQLGEGVVVEPFAVIKKNVVLEDNVVIKAHAYIDGNTTIGSHTTIYPSAVIGTKTQDLKFRGEQTFVKIGSHCEIREFVTINSSCEEGSVVEVGDNCLIMAYCHIAHNCKVGNRVIMSNSATLAGHVTIEDFAIIGGLTPIHQFVRVGCYAMVGGLSRVAQDVPPYTLGGGVPYKMGGLNVIGLQRHQVPLKTRQQLSKAFRYIYRSNLRLEEALSKCETELESLPEIEHLIAFCRNTERGLISLNTVKSDKKEDVLLANS